ncbi:MAG: hypothetical protein L3K06_07100, partial [Thermoplasmata archaeon]|nr:hypothetical protein [Thermoplasmata archaeon]
SLEELVPRLRTAFLDRPDGWFLGGSVSGMLQGAAVVPREVEIGTDRIGTTQVATALAEYLIEPLADTSWRGTGPIFGARAYLGTLRSGVRVEWGVPIGPAPSARLELREGTDEVATRPVPFLGGTVRVLRPEYGLLRAAARRDPAETAAVAAVLRSEGADTELLARLLAESGLAPTDQDRLKGAVRSPAA